MICHNAIMKNICTIFLSALFAIIFAGCATTIPSEKIIERHDCEVIIDVRTPEEFSEIHVSGAISMPVDIIEEEIAEYDIPKDAKIGVYCKKGVRAEKARAKLQRLGYKNVTNLGSIKRLERIAGSESEKSTAPKQWSRESIF